MRAIDRALENEKFSNLAREQAPMAELETVALAHPMDYVEAIRDAAQGTRTAKLSLKAGNSSDTIDYTAVVARGTPAPLMVWEDPELEVGPDSGGPPPPAKKSAPKKKTSKKKKK